MNLDSYRTAVVLSVACPWCSSGIGEPCWQASPGMHVEFVHDARGLAFVHYIMPTTIMPGSPASKSLAAAVRARSESMASSRVASGSHSSGRESAGNDAPAPESPCPQCHAYGGHWPVCPLLSLGGKSPP